MKVYIGPYKRHYSLYNMTRWIEDWIGEEKYDKYFYETKWFKYLSNSKIFTLVNKFNENRSISIKVHDYDAWGADDTLAMVIHPVLVKLRENKHSAGHVDDEDVPEELRSTSAPKPVKSGESDDNFFKRWDYVLDEMIWAFNEIIEGTWEDQYHSGVIDFGSIPVDANGNIVAESEAKFYQMVTGPNHTHKIDMDGLKAHRDKIQNGLRLFAKYYFSLWD